MFNRSCDLSKEEKYEQSLICAVNEIFAISDEIDSKVVSISSSLSDFYENMSFVKDIVDEADKLNKKVALVNLSLSDKTSVLDSEEIFKENRCFKILNNPSNSDLQELLNELKDKYDLVMVIIPPIRVYAKAVQYAKICENIILLEKYSYSRYKHFEDTLDILKRNKVYVEGVITFN